ncbi:hypothetical protein [Clostridium sp.]|uniref:hypothetical protein n=1 Tax=Clostridium sp. TaxID=1506 RepID=UPI00290DD92C|nr:hypothetical protein [Clostridium sp.]MDU5105361.1 hypothetical protein [Clostridium sp.]
MLQLSPIEFILRGLPEGFLVIFAVYIFSKTKIDKKKYLVTSIIFSLIIYIVRLLPISYGVHMILSLFSLLLIIVFYNKIDVIKGIKSIIFIYLIQLISELINVLILNIMNIDLEVLSLDPVYKNILGFPSLIITAIIIYIIFRFNKKRRKL